MEDISNLCLDTFEESIYDINIRLFIFNFSNLLFVYIILLNFDIKEFNDKNIIEWKKNEV